jgi:hypothetical protein
MKAELASENVSNGQESFEVHYLNILHVLFSVFFPSKNIIVQAVR